MPEQRKPGTRCKICTFCGRCFTEKDAPASDEKAWDGKRCDVCLGCGKCAEQWGLVGSDDADAISGPTSWADAFKVMDTGFAGDAPPIPGAPGVSGVKPTHEIPSSDHLANHGESDDECDATTGATPGVATACSELGLNDMSALQKKLGINPPGM